MVIVYNVTTLKGVVYNCNFCTVTELKKLLRIKDRTVLEKYLSLACEIELITKSGNKFLTIPKNIELWSKYDYSLAYKVLAKSDAVLDELNRLKASVNDIRRYIESPHDLDVKEDETDG